MPNVVFFHIGGIPNKDPVIRTAMAHAVRKGATVHLVTDSDRHDQDNVTLIPYAQFADSVEELRSVYKHHSPNSVEFEFGCYARWFVFRDLAKSLGSFFFSDSDLLLFDQYTDASRLLKGSQFFDSAWFNYNSAENVLAPFCDFLLETYRNETLFEAVRAEVNKMFAWPADRVHFADMCSLYAFQARRRDICIPLRLGFGNRLGFDTNIHGGIGYETHLPTNHGLIKKVYWKGDAPYCRRLSDGAFVKFRTLHFQGTSKPIMMYYADLLQSDRSSPEFVIKAHSKADWWPKVRAELDAAGGRLIVPEGAVLIDPLEPYFAAAA